MRPMEGFRLVALGYALLVFLIAPAWISADEAPPAVPVPTVEAPTEAVQEAVPELPVETPVTTSDEADDPEAEPDRKRKRKADSDTKPDAEPAKAAKSDQKAPDNEPVAESSATASVIIRDFEFAPATVTVNEGDTVTWTNEGPTPHTATADDGSFDTGTLREGESGSATFTSAGTISYICTPHPNMTGTVVVQAASAGSGNGSGGSSDTTDDGSSVAGDSDTSDDTGSSLPSTGAEALSIALLGIATLGIGLLLRRRHEA